jgi:hypothetical protein
MEELESNLFSCHGIGGYDLGGVAMRLILYSNYVNYV